MEKECLTPAKMPELLELDEKINSLLSDQEESVLSILQSLNKLKMIDASCSKQPEKLDDLHLNNRLSNKIMRLKSINEDLIKIKNHLYDLV